MESGFADKCLQHLITRRDVTDRHLNFVLSVWCVSITYPFRASKLELSKVVCRAREKRVYERLFTLGMKATVKDLMPAVINLPDSSHSCLELILTRIKEVHGIKQGPLDEACKAALLSKKEELGRVLIEHSATPTAPDLLQCPRLLSNPVVLKHLTALTHITTTKEKEERGVNTVHYYLFVYSETCT